MRMQLTIGLAGLAGAAKVVQGLSAVPVLCVCVRRFDAIPVQRTAPRGPSPCLPLLPEVHEAVIGTSTSTSLSLYALESRIRG